MVSRLYVYFQYVGVHGFVDHVSLSSLSSVKSADFQVGIQLQYKRR
jgi:hypothetical protein